VIPPTPAVDASKPVHPPELPADLGGYQPLTLAQIAAFEDFEAAQKREVSPNSEAFIGGLTVAQAVADASLPGEEP
jgi:hypothetical protein